MISKDDREKIRETAKKFKVKRVLLFGSSLSSDTQAKDIDIAVEGLAPEKFFEFYGALLFQLSKPVDVVDLSQKSRFTDFISRKGVVIYGC